MNATATLTKRESEVAELIAWGASKKDIAHKLFISERTAENHARSIYEKTGVTKVNELSAWWFCTRFKISFDLSPFKRAFIAVSLLLILIPRELSHDDDSVMRTRRGKRVEMRASRGRRVSNWDLFEYE